MNGASYFSCQIKNVYITLSILYDSMGGGASLFADSLSYLKKVRGVGRYAGGEDRKTLHPHVSWDIIHASTGKY